MYFIFENDDEILIKKWIITLIEEISSHLGMF